MKKHELAAIGGRIEALRKGKGWTQEMLADKLKIARNTLTKLEGGFRDFKSTEILNVAKVLEVSTDYLLGLTNIAASIEQLLYGKQAEGKAALVQSIHPLYPEDKAELAEELAVLMDKHLAKMVAARLLHFLKDRDLERRKK